MDTLYGLLLGALYAYNVTAGTGRQLSPPAPGIVFADAALADCGAGRLLALGSDGSGAVSLCSFNATSGEAPVCWPVKGLVPPPLSVGLSIACTPPHRVSIFGPAAPNGSAYAVGTVDLSAPNLLFTPSYTFDASLAPPFGTVFGVDADGTALSVLVNGTSYELWATSSTGAAGVAIEEFETGSDVLLMSTSPSTSSSSSDCFLGLGYHLSRGRSVVSACPGSGSGSLAPSVTELALANVYPYVIGAGVVELRGSAATAASASPVLLYLGSSNASVPSTAAYYFIGVEASTGAVVIKSEAPVCVGLQGCPSAIA